MHVSTEKQKISDNPLVSIIVITYNSAQFVLETLESAKSQTYQNIELIISDDGSSDNTVELCRNWISKNENRFVRVKLLDPDRNSGIPANCNQGVAASQGDWAKLIAGDDILEDNCIEDNLNFAVESGSFLIFSELTYFSEGNFRYADNIEEGELRREFSKLESEKQLKFYSRYPLFLNQPTLFYKNTKNVKYDEEFRYLEDQPFLFRFLSSGKKIDFLDRVTVRYRKHTSSAQIGNTQLKDEFIYCYKKYRRKNLRLTSIVDFLFALNFFVECRVMKSKGSFLARLLFIPIRKLNPVVLLKISPMANIDD